MARPRVKFLDPEPLELSCTEPCEVNLEVWPRTDGPCKVVLSTVSDICKFEEVTEEAPAPPEVDPVTGEAVTSRSLGANSEPPAMVISDNKLEQEVTLKEGQTSVTCTFKLKMNCSQADSFTLLIFAHAINSEDTHSFQKNYEARITCLEASLPSGPSAPGPAAVS
ncbi:MAG: hypothetical protein AAGI38_07650 [Bacteroidota bacterium]